MRVWLAVLAVVLVLASCSPFGPKSVKLYDGPLPISVAFSRQADSVDGRHCHYRISRQGEAKSLVVVPSRIDLKPRGVDDRPFRLGRHYMPQSVVSPSGNVVLIVEDCWDAVPNDAYLLVEFDASGSARASYVRLPLGRLPPYGDWPRVASVSDSLVEVVYSDSSKRSLPLASLPRILPKDADAR